MRPHDVTAIRFLRERSHPVNFTVNVDELSASGDRATLASEQALGVDLSQVLVELSDGMPASAAQYAAPSIVETLLAAQRKWATEAAAHGANLSGAAGDYQRTDDAAAFGFAQVQGWF